MVAPNYPETRSTLAKQMASVAAVQLCLPRKSLLVSLAES